MTSTKRPTDLPPTSASVITPAVREKFYASPFILNRDTLLEVLRVSSGTGRAMVRKYVLEIPAGRIGIDGEECLDHINIARQTMGMKFENQNMTGGRILLAYREENGFSIKLDQPSVYFDMGRKFETLMQYRMQAAEIIQGLIKEIDPQAAIERLPDYGLNVEFMVRLRF
jgi:hypothetical protein